MKGPFASKGGLSLIRSAANQPGSHYKPLLRTFKSAFVLNGQKGLNEPNDPQERKESKESKKWNVLRQQSVGKMIDQFVKAV